MTIDKDKLIKILPELIKSDDGIRGAIIAALEGVLATKEDIKLIIQAMDRRFEAGDRRFEEMDRRFGQLILEVKEIKAAVGSLGGRVGINLEKTILEVLRETLIEDNIDIKQITAKKIKDWDAEIFQRGTPVQMDILGEDGDRIFIEIKFHVTTEDVMLFDKKCDFFVKKLGEPTQKLIIGLEFDEEAKELANEYGFKIITKKTN